MARRRRIEIGPGDTFGGTVPLILLKQVTAEPPKRSWPWFLLLAVGVCVLGLVLFAAGTAGHLNVGTLFGGSG